MTVVLISNEAALLDSLSALFALSYTGSELTRFTDPLLSMKYILNNRVDVILADGRMRPVSGFVLLKMLRKLRPAVPVIILSDDEDTRSQAMQQHADGYWLKPLTEKNIAEIPLIIQQKQKQA